MSIVTSAVSPAAANGASPSTSRGTQFSGDTFITLLVAQFNNQDPLSPQDPTQTVAQLAALSQVTTLQDIDSTLKRLEAALSAIAPATSPASPGEATQPK